MLNKQTKKYSEIFTDCPGSHRCKGVPLNFRICLICLEKKEKNKQVAGKNPPPPGKGGGGGGRGEGRGRGKADGSGKGRGNPHGTNLQQMSLQSDEESGEDDALEQFEDNQSDDEEEYPSPPSHEFDEHEFEEQLDPAQVGEFQP